MTIYACEPRGLRKNKGQNRKIYLAETISLVALVCASSLSSTPAVAADPVWLGGNSTDFGNNTNWSGNTVPGASDNVFINVSPGQFDAYINAGVAYAVNIVEVGRGGNGALFITDGGSSLTSAFAEIGYGAADVGEVTVSNNGTWTNTGSLRIGVHGTGKLDISTGGAVFVGGDAYVGGLDQGNGSVTVSGAGSSLSVDQKLLLGVGVQSQGNMTVGDGATVSVQQDVILASSDSTSSGGLTVSSGATFTTDGALRIGVQGDGRLALDTGGTVNVAGGTGTVFMAWDAGSNAVLTIGLANGVVGAGTLNASMVQFGSGTAEVLFNHSDTDYVFAAGFESDPGIGSATIEQAAGTTILTGYSGNFHGNTVVGGGTLIVNTTLGGTMEVWSTGRLQGIGTVGDTTVFGTIAPGTSIGTLNVAGSITFNSSSIYEVEVNAAGQGDRIAASGNAIINGGTVTVLAGLGNYAPQTQYTILTASGADGRSGTFDSVTSNLAFLDPSLSYDANNVYLTMTRNDINFTGVGLTANQIATGAGVESLGWGNPVYNAVVNLSADQARYAFDQLSGEIHASAKTALIEDSRFIRTAVNDRLRGAFDGVGASGTVTTYVDGRPMAVKADTGRLAVWGQGFGSWGHADGDGNAARLDRSTGGFFLGADAPVFDTWRFGAVAGYSRSNFDVEDRHSSGASDNYHLGLYGGTAWGNLAFRTGAAYAWNDISTSRTVIFPGFSDRLTGDYNAATAQVFGEFAYGVIAGAARFEPFANLAYVNLHTDGLTEQGGPAALTSPSSDTDATFTTLGLRASTGFDVGGARLTAKGTLGWRHVFGDVTPFSLMGFAGGGDAFLIAGVPIARDAAVIEAGLDYAIAPNAVLGVAYGGQFGSGMSDQSVKANFDVKF